MTDKIGKKTLEVMAHAENYNKWIMSWLRPHIGKNILETGAGIGNFSGLLEKYGKLTLIDFNKKYIKVLKQKGFESGYGDIEKGDYYFSKAKKFDTIINLNVIEHIKDDTKVLNNFYRLLSPGGKLLLLTPAHQSVYSPLDKGLGHFRRYSKEDLSKKLKDQGFIISDLRYLNVLGLVGWFVTGKVFGQKSLKTDQLSLFELISKPFLLLDKIIKLPVGLSVFVVAEKPSDRPKIKKISIVIPAYNEEATIETIIERVKAVSLKNLSKEILVVNDGSTDNTAKVLKKLTNIKVINKPNGGKGSAIIEGLKNASGDVVIIQDADLEYNPKDYPKLLKPIQANKANVVYGTRLRTLELKLFGKNKTLHPQNYIANKILSLFTNFLLGTELTDMETCYKVFRRELINPNALGSSGFEIEPELTSLFAKQQEKIHEVDIKVTPRGYTEGKKIKPRDGIIAIRTLLSEKFFK